jgi:hypothetical protein
MKRLFFTLVALGMLYSSSPSRAATTVLTFEGLQNLEPILNYYNGGLGGLGSGPGPNDGIVFGPDSLAIIQQAVGGSGNFFNNPSGVTIGFFLSGPGDVMDVPGGFDTGFSFFYDAANFPGTVTVWSGLDGTGMQLASLNLAVTPHVGPDPYTYDNWAAQGVSFSGTAESVVFTGTANQIGFDDITLGSDVPGGGPTAPAPAALVLYAIGFSGLPVLLRRRKAA